jgi:exonuclease SbcC
MPKIMLVGDMHLKDKRLNDIAEAWRRAVSLASKNGVDLIAQAGDVFDHVNVYGKNEVVGTIYDAFLSPYRDQEKPIRTIIIPGNHDIGGAMDKDALTPIDCYPWITVARRPEVVDVMPGLSVCAVPWVSRSNLVSKLVQRGSSPGDAAGKVGNALSDLFHELRSKVEERRRSGRFVLFLGHLEVTGAKLTGGQVQSGGAFEFSPASLASIGASAYALAHIHIRQPVPGLPNPNDGYLGALCQLSFGEEGNAAGCRVIEVAGDKIVSDQWVNNSASPRYVTVSSLEEKGFRDVDHVRLRAETRPDVLPAGIIFERLRHPDDVQSPRAGRMLDCDTPLPDLIAAWAESSKSAIPAKDLLPPAQDMAASAPRTGDAVGSLDRVDRISLANVTCHRATNVNLAGLSGPCGVDGPNGSGKTTLVEAILVALFGASPSRPSLNSLAAQDAKEPSVVEVDFVSGGKKYMARREFKGGSAKGLTHKAFLYEGDKLLHGPKVEDVGAACEALVGDPGMVLAGVFSAQGESGNMIELRPAERKDLFAKLLGTHRFLALSEQAKAKANGVAAHLEVQKARCADLRTELMSEDDDAAAVARLKEEARSIRESQATLSAKLDATRVELSRVEASKRERSAAEARLAALRGDMEASLAQGRELKKQREALASFSCHFSDEEVASARRAKNDITAAIIRRSEAQAKWAASMQGATRMRAEADKVRADRAAAYSSMVIEESRRADDVRERRAAPRQALVDEASSIRAKLESAKARLAESAKHSSMLGDFPDQEICKRCPLASDSIRARDDAPDAGRAVERLGEQLSKFEAQVRTFDEETAKLSMRPDPGMPDSWMPEATRQAGNLADAAGKAEAEADGHKASALSEGLAGLEAMAARLPEMEAAMIKAAQRDVTLAGLDAQLGEKRARFRELEKQVSAFKLPEAPDDMATRAILSDMTAQSMSLMAKLSDSDKSLGAAEAKAAAHQRRRADLVDAESKAAAHSKDAEVLLSLARAFGRDGIPQMIVEGAIPRFQEVMAKLLEEFDGRWSIKVASQKLTKAGTTQEVIDILVDAGDGPRDIGTFSGGEKKILRTIVRVAFSTLQAERSGKGLKVLVLDEATDSMDDENSATVIGMLGKLSAFNQIFVVSHNPRVLSSIPSKISFHADGSPPSVVMATVVASPVVEEARA